ncbi:MAG: hypothetical protein JKY32_10435 [Rhizobiales bacterium]|nr:hypothetical protein [Hyphomicrobiales bacterium]
MIVRIIARLFLVSFAYFLAAIAAGTTFAAALAVSVASGFSLPEALFVGIPIGVIFGFIAIAPAAIIIVAAELFRLRSWIFYAIAGALTALGSWTLFELPIFREIMIEFSWLSKQGLFREISQDLGAAFRQIMDGNNALLVISATGLVGGLAYWVVAGNAAGSVLHIGSNDEDD